MSFDAPAERTDTVAQQSVLRANDADPMTSEHVSDDMASRARARKHLEQRIVSLFSALQPRVVPYTLDEILATPLSASAPLKSLLTQFNALAPIHILPTELFLAIISLRVFGPSKKQGQELAKLGTVCTSWRSITLSSPNLWKYINLRRTAYAALAVKRSQNIPVHIAFRVLNDRHRSPGPEDYRIISNLAPRIASMKFSLPIHLNPELLENFPLALPLLHELVLKTGSRKNYIYTDTLLLGSASTPALRILDLTAYGVLFDADTKLSTVAATPPVSLPRLQNLDLQAWQLPSSLCHYAALVMGTITAIPTTAKLSIACSTDNDTFEFSSAGTSSGTISLSNSRAIRTDPEMHYLLDRLPSVRMFHVSWDGYSDKKFLLLMLNGLNMQRLETLGTMGIPVTILAEVLKNRGVGALKSLRMNYLPDDEMEVESDAEELARDIEETERGTALLKELVAEVEIIDLV